MVNSRNVSTPLRTDEIVSIEPPKSTNRNVDMKLIMPNSNHDKKPIRNDSLMASSKNKHPGKFNSYPCSPMKPFVTSNSKTSPPNSTYFNAMATPKPKNEKGRVRRSSAKKNQEFDTNYAGPKFCESPRAQILPVPEKCAESRPFVVCQDKQSPRVPRSFAPESNIPCSVASEVCAHVSNMITRMTPLQLISAVAGAQ